MQPTLRLINAHKGRQDHLSKIFDIIAPCFIQYFLDTATTRQHLHWTPSHEMGYSRVIIHNKMPPIPPRKRKIKRVPRPPQMRRQGPEMTQIQTRVALLGNVTLQQQIQLLDEKGRHVSPARGLLQHPALPELARRPDGVKREGIGWRGRRRGREEGVVPEEADEADRGRVQGGRSGFGGRPREDVAVKDEDGDVQEDGLDAGQDLEGPLWCRGGD